MGVTYRIDVTDDIDTTIETVTPHCEQGFGVFTPHRRARHPRADARRRHRAVGHPRRLQPATRPPALEADPRIAARLPCNVVIALNTRTADAFDPRRIADIPDNDALRPIAEDAATRIRAALDEVANR